MGHKISSIALLGVFTLVSLTAKSQHASHALESVGANDQRVVISGSVSINGEPFNLSAQGTVNQTTGDYSLRFSSPDIFTSQSICRLEGALAAWIPRLALKFVVEERGAKQAAFVPRGAESLWIEVTGAPKRDLVSGLNRLSGSVHIQRTPKGAVSLRVSGAINTANSPCWGLEATPGMYGHSVLRLGIRSDVSRAGTSAGGSFVGIGRIDFEVPDGDPQGLGHSDFWNLDGTFSLTGPPQRLVGAVHSIDVSHIEKETAVVGSISNFSGTTIPMRAVLTIGGTATREGFIHQHLGISNGRGGGPALTHFDVPVKAGDVAAQIAARVAEGINQSSAGFKGGGHFLAVQGGTGVDVQKSDPNSARIAFCVTRDGIRCIAPNDRATMKFFSHTMTQAFGDAGFRSFQNSGVTETFGVLGEPPLVGWLTPFKVVFFTDNPVTSLRAVGGELRIQSNTCRSSNGGDCSPGTIRTSPPVTIKTFAGETPDEIARDVARALTKVGTKCIQRVGNILYMDAGLEMPSTLTVWSGDPGVGLMSAAADLPTLADPHPNVIPSAGKESADTAVNPR